MTCTCETNPPGIHLCAACCDGFEELLGRVDDVVEDLTRVMGDVSLTAQYGANLPVGTKIHADLPFNVEAYDKREAIHRYLVEACTLVATETRERFGLAVHALTNYLFSNMNHLRASTDGPLILGKLRKLVSAGAASVALVEPKQFAGTCQVDGTELYARQGEQTARCRTCGETYEVQAWRAHAGIAKEYHVGTPAELSRALTSPAYGIEVSADLIWRWAKRGKLERANEEAGEDGKPLKPTYRLSDVLDLNAKRKPIDGQAA